MKYKVGDIVLIDRGKGIYYSKRWWLVLIISKFDKKYHNVIILDSSFKNICRMSRQIVNLQDPEIHSVKKIL